MVRVLVQTLGGEQAELEMYSDDTVHALKLEVATALHVLLDCQQLLIGDEVPPDSACIADFCDDEDEGLEVLLIVSLDEVLARLDGRKKQERVRALRALAQAAPKGDEDVLAAVRDRIFYDEEKTVRKAAVEALARLTPAGVTELINSLSLCFANSHTDVVQTAAQVFAQSVPRGNDEALQFLQSIVANGRGSARREALHAMGEVASEGSTRLMDSIRFAIEDADHSVRKAALSVIIHVATGTGGRDILDLVKGRVHDTEPAVRTAALQALAKVSKRGDMSVLETLAARLLEEPNCETRSWVPGLLVSACEPGCGFVIDTLGAYLQGHVSSQEGFGALGALEQLAEAGKRADDRIARIALRCMASTYARAGEFMLVALRLLSKTVAADDERLVDMARSCMTRMDPSLRSYAIVVLFSWLARRTDAVDLLDSSLSDPHASVRTAALGALDKVAEASLGKNGDCRATLVARVRPMFCDADWKVRRAAVKLVGKVYIAGDGETLADLRYAMNDRHGRVRSIVLETWASISRTDQQIAADLRPLVMQCMDDENTAVKLAAGRLLPQVAERGDPDAVAALVKMAGLRNMPDAQAVAVLALGGVAKPIPEGGPAIQVVSKCVGSKNGLVRRAAVESFVKLAGRKAQEEHLRPILETLARGCTGARVASMEVLKQVGRGSDEVLELVCASLREDKSVKVRQAAVPALVALARRGHVPTVRALRACLALRNEALVQAAVNALPLIAIRGDAEVARDLLACVEKPCANVRCAVVEALSDVMAPEDPRLTEVLRSCLADTDESVRRAAGHELVVSAFRSKDCAGMGAISHDRLAALCRSLGDWSEAEIAALRDALQRDLGRTPSGEDFAKWAMAAEPLENPAGPMT